MSYDKYVMPIIDSYYGVINKDEYFNQLSQILKKDISREEALNVYENLIKDKTFDYLDAHNRFGNFVTGVSTGVYLKSLYGKGSYDFNIYGGKRSRYSSELVDENTLFDVASITKLFTFILLLKLEELGYLSLDSKIKDVNPDFQNLGDYTFRDLIRLHGEFRTNGNVAENGISIEEADRRFKTLYLLNDNKTENKYTDFGAMVISNSISKIMSNVMERSVSYAEVLDEYILKPLGMNKTTFNPSSLNVSGNGRCDNLVHDPKTRNLGGVTGSAGLFMLPSEVSLLSSSLYGDNPIISKEHIDMLGEITFPNAKQRCKGNLGIYVKAPNDESFVPSEFSTGSFAHQGWTGNQAMFDPHKKISMYVFANAIARLEKDYYSNVSFDEKGIMRDNETGEQVIRNDKLNGYGANYSKYSHLLTTYVVLMSMINEMYDTVIDKDSSYDISNTLSLKI